MSGQGKQMPGVVAREMQEDAAQGSSQAGIQPGAQGGPKGGSPGGGSGKGQPGASEAGRPGPAASGGGAGPHPARADGFDDWLRAELGRLYGSALDEQVPDDMLRLLNEAARKG